MGDRYVLGVDVGNTNTVFGLFRDEPDFEILHSWRTVTRRDRTSDELGIFLLGFLNSSGIVATEVGGFIYSSVVPPFSPIVERMGSDYFRCDPLRVRFDMGLPIGVSYPHPAEIGADRLANAAGAHAMCRDDLIIVDLGTATTFCLLEDGSYRGGVIAPGLKVSIEALTRKTAQLPPIEFARPSSGVLGDTTVHSLQSGFFYGWVGLLRGIIGELKDRDPKRNYTVFATGGLSNLISRETPGLFDRVDDLLTLRGLKTIWRHQASFL